MAVFCVFISADRGAVFVAKKAPRFLEGDESALSPRPAIAPGSPFTRNDVSASLPTFE